MTANPSTIRPIAAAVQSAHAKLSASGSFRWATCAASPTMEAGYEDTTNPLAAFGTAGHELAEISLIMGIPARQWVGAVFEVDGLEIKVTDEMAEAVEEYVGYINEHTNRTSKRFIEKRVDFSPWVPGGFGTADCIIIDGNVCKIIDLKMGEGVRVFAENNTQGVLYALGVFHDFGDIFEFDVVEITIHQPRLDHVDVWRITVADLLRIGEWLKQRAQLTLEPNPDFTPSEKACQFCKARFDCKARAVQTLEQCVEDFSGIEPGMTLKEVNTLTNDDKAILMGHVKNIKKFASDLEDSVYRDILKGEHIEGFKLVEGRSNRKWRSNEAAAEALANVIDEAELFEQKMITPPKAEKLLGKNHAVLDGLIIKPEGKPTVAKESDKRPAISMAASDDFD